MELFSNQPERKKKRIKEEPALEWKREDKGLKIMVQATSYRVYIYKHIIDNANSRDWEKNMREEKKW